MKVNIRTVTPTDISDIYKVHQASIHGINEGLYPKKMINAWAAGVSCKALQEEIESPETIGFLAESVGKICGFAALRHQAVCAMYVHPQYQCRGIGSRLLDRLEAEAARKGIHRLRLNASLNAGSFYEGKGYHVIRETPFAFNNSVSLASLEMAKDII